MPNELIVFLTAAAPISELRGAIPLGIYFFGKENLFKVLILSIAGNASIIIPVLFLLEPISNWSRKHVPFLRKFFDWLFERSKNKSDIVQRFELLGLIIFVGIPLPMTGAWSGCAVASLLKMRFRNAFFGVFAGVVLAALIVSLLCIVGIFSYNKIVS